MMLMLLDFVLLRLFHYFGKKSVIITSIFTGLFLHEFFYYFVSSGVKYSIGHISFFNNRMVTKLLAPEAFKVGSKVQVRCLREIEGHTEGVAIRDGLWRPGGAFFQIGLGCVMSHHHIEAILAGNFKMQFLPTTSQHSLLETILSKFGQICATGNAFVRLMHLLLHSRSERGGARRAPTKRVLYYS